MNSLNRILINAIYEIKIFLRSWFFRIFAGLSFVLLFFINLIFFSNVTQVPRIFNGLSSFGAYANFYLLNIVQCAVLVFLATDIIKRDQKINTNQVFYIRSMTNFEYLFGKALGLFFVFAGLNIIIMIMGVLYQLLFPETNFVWQPFLLYPVLMSLPSIVYILGLSFFTMLLIKNQAVTIILMLGYFSAELFYLDEKLYHILDFLALNLPLTYSDFVGITHFEQILLHRGLYFLLGIIFFLLSVLLFQRLYQSRLIKRLLSISIPVGLVVAIFMGISFYSYHTDQENLRDRINELNTEYLNTPTVQMLKCNLDLIHQGNEIAVKAEVRFVNSTDTPLDQYFFSINPGLNVNKIEKRTGNFSFKQSDHIIEVIPEEPLKSGQLDSLQIYYSGKIDESYCYLDIDEKNIKDKFSIWMYQIDKKYAFIENEFVLLTPECNWYPVAGLTYGVGFPQKNKKDFIDFKLQVNTNKELTAISQGKVEVSTEGKYKFIPENHLSDIALIIAPYTVRTATVDSINYNLYTLPEHNYFENYFSQISDTLFSIIRESKQDFEHKLGMEYPFSQLNVIEVPIQFFTYPRIWTAASQRVCPEMALIPENGIYLPGADFKSLSRMQERRTERNQMTLTDQEKEAFLFMRFLNFTLLGGNPQFRFIGNLMHPEQPNHNIFPNYYTYTTHFYSESLTLFNSALESYFYEKVSVSGEVSSWFNARLTTAETASRSLNGKSLKEHLEADSTKSEKLSNILKLKGANLIRLLQSAVDREKLYSQLVRTVNENRFKSSSVSIITEMLNEQFKLDILPYFNDWYSSNKLPGFIIKDLELFKVMDKDRLRYQILFKIANPEQVTGLTDIRFRFAGRRWFEDRSTVEEPVRIVKLEPGQTKEVGIVLDSEPNIIYMNPGIALNIPLAYAHRFEDTELKENYKPFNGEKILDYRLDVIPENEFIVDNEDDLFKAKGNSEKSFLQKIIHGEEENKEKEFIMFRFWNPPEQWELVKSTGFYGKYIYSALYIQSGSGDKRAQWEINLEDSGNYTLYTYVANKFSFGRREIYDNHLGDFHYIIYHDDGENEIVIDWLKAEEGWNELGSYYFSSGKAKVELTNKSNGKIVVADAVKWVKN